LKALGADYKHELLGERLTTTQKLRLSKIAEGCDRPCSFVLFQSCAENTFRKLLKISKEAEGLARDGVKELILIAQDLTYGLDIYKKRNLGELLEALVKVEGIEWIRLHYAFLLVSLWMFYHET
jgi:ribosomal protein S12 methylthiotransferase